MTNSRSFTVQLVAVACKPLASCLPTIDGFQPLDVFANLIFHDTFLDGEPTYDDLVKPIFGIERVKRGP